MAVNGHARGFSVQHFQALGDVGHADSGSSQPRRFFQKVRGTHAYAIVFHFNDQLRVGQPAAQKNAATFDLGRKAMLDGVFDQRLKQHTGHHHVE